MPLKYNLKFEFRFQNFVLTYRLNFNSHPYLILYCIPMVGNVLILIIIFLLLNLCLCCSPHPLVEILLIFKYHLFQEDCGPPTANIFPLLDVRTLLYLPFLWHLSYSVLYYWFFQFVYSVIFCLFYSISISVDQTLSFLGIFYLPLYSLESLANFSWAIRRSS